MNIFMFRFMFSLFFYYLNIVFKINEYCIQNKWFSICYISNPLGFLKCYIKSKHTLEFIMHLMKKYILQLKKKR